MTDFAKEARDLATGGIADRLRRTEAALRRMHAEGAAARAALAPFAAQFERREAAYAKRGSAAPGWFAEMPDRWPITIEVTMGDCRKARALVAAQDIAEAILSASSPALTDYPQLRIVGRGDGWIDVATETGHIARLIPSPPSAAYFNAPAPQGGK